MGTDQIPAPSCRPGTVGVTGQNNRLFVEAVLDRFRPGIPWRDLPIALEKNRVIHTRFSPWSNNGVIQRVFQVLSAFVDNQYAALDATIVRGHQLPELKTALLARKILVVLGAL